MKSLLTTFFFLFFIIGCAQKNAFERFNLTEKEELSLNSLQSSKIRYKNKINGVISVVYLNEVYPQIDKNSEVFYVSMYLKDKSNDIKFQLNGKKPSLWVKELPNNNEFSQLISDTIPWNRHFVVTFAKQGDTLVFKVQNNQFSSKELIFKKDE